jgi:hypothetical protein
MNFQNVTTGTITIGAPPRGKKKEGTNLIFLAPFATLHHRPNVGPAVRSPAGPPELVPWRHHHHRRHHHQQQRWLSGPSLNGGRWRASFPPASDQWASFLSTR